MNPLHVANGGCTTRLIDASGLPGRTLSWADSLYDGPVPDVSDAELDRVRARFHAPSEDKIDEYAHGFASWRAAVDDLNGYDELVLWYEHDLFDQLNLIQILSHLGRQSVLPKPVSLVSIDRHPTIANFKGLGELTVPDIAALFETRTPIHEAQIVVAKRAWAAFRSADPHRIEEFLHSDTSALPFLAAALRRHLEEFPSSVNGLSKYETRILQLAAEGADVAAIFAHVQDGEKAYYLTDASLSDRINELTTSTPPLLHKSESGTLSLTDEGRAVLAGNADRVRLCGIDRWLGGVHLTGTGPVWRWDTALRSIQQA